MSKEKRTVQAEEINLLLKSIIGHFRKFVSNHIKDLGLTVPQLLLLRVLYQQPEQTLSELCQQLGLAKSTVSDLVDRLEKQELVVKRRGEQDRRTVRISLAEKTMALGETIQAIKTDYWSALLSQLTPAEVEEILRALRKLQGLISASPSHTKGEVKVHDNRGQTGATGTGPAGPQSGGVS
ncbi:MULTISPECIES: MarR family winged helix-turn-helix transcriptional regulator [Carboxydocella]|uniref:MarR family winged helix-turn-helix transcriptional regulator n=1 Tax=Carboxydocella TaxID=178898 RepID=UPI00099914BE|nr:MULTISPECIES: MarR family transcriptional regulator [Carboxydocella]